MLNLGIVVSWKCCFFLMLLNGPGVGVSYALFPLLLLFDAAVAGRSSTSSAKTEFSAKGQVVRIGDRVAEGVLSCVEVILQRCIVQTTSQVNSRSLWWRTSFFRFFRFFRFFDIKDFYVMKNVNMMNLPSRSISGEGG